MNNFVALIVRTVEDAEVGPLAPGFLLRITNEGDQIGALGILGGEHDYRYRRAGKLNTGFYSVLFTGGLQRRTVVGTVRVLREHGRVSIDQGKSAAEDRSGGTAVLLENNTLGVRKMAVE